MGDHRGATMEAADKMRATQEAADAGVSLTEGNTNNNSDSPEADGSKPKLYPKGWRLHTLTAG